MSRRKERQKKDRRKERREKERRSEAENLKKKLTQISSKFEAPLRDSKAKEGLFRKGFRTKHLKRVEGIADARKFARLNGDLDEIISLVNGEVPSIRFEETSVWNKSHSKHTFLKPDKSPPSQKSNVHSSFFNNQGFDPPGNRAGFSKHFFGEKRKTQSGKENIPSHEHNFENLANTQAVKKARTAEFINSLPSIFEEETKLSTQAAGHASSSSADKKLREAHMTRCFDELTSSIGHSLLNLRNKRYGKINYNEDLKNAIINEYHGTCQSASSSSTYYSGSTSIKSPSPRKHLDLDPGKCNLNLEQSAFLSPTITVPSPPILSSQMDNTLLSAGNAQFNSHSNSLQYSFLPREDSHLNSHSSSLQKDSQPSMSRLFASQSFGSQRLSSQLYCPETLTDDWMTAPVQQCSNASMQHFQNSSNFFDNSSEKMSNFAQPERPLPKEPMGPPSQPSPNPDSLIPKFKFYPRNMF